MQSQGQNGTFCGVWEILAALLMTVFMSGPALCSKSIHEELIWSPNCISDWDLEPWRSNGGRLGVKTFGELESNHNWGYLHHNRTDELILFAYVLLYTSLQQTVLILKDAAFCFWSYFTPVLLRWWLTDKNVPQPCLGKWNTMPPPTPAVRRQRSVEVVADLN